MSFVDLTGKRYGKLVVVKFDHAQSTYNYWECLCDCGNTVVVRGANLKNGFLQSCGCPVLKTDLVKYEPKAAEIKVGQKVYFDPFLEITGFSSELNRGKKVVGTVVMVNYPHQWFSVEYGDPKQRTSFKFSQIGTEVNILRK